MQLGFRTLAALVVGIGMGAMAPAAWAQPGQDDFPRPFGPGGGGPGFPGGGPGGPGGPMGQERKLVAQFDKDGDGKLNAAERAEARKSLAANGEGRRGPGRMGPGGMGRGNDEPVKPGPKVAPSEVKTYPQAALYEPTALRTIFLEFENSEWETELADFYNSDVEVPAVMTVDGVKYPGVGVHFRGASSYFTVAPGHKRSLNVSVDFTDSKARLYGHKTLNLLNAHEDASMMSTVLYSHIARQYIPVPKANFAKVVINGESWGVYVNVEQFSKDFVNENFKVAKSKDGHAARWKVKGSPGADGGLGYVGDKIEAYEQRYEIKTTDDEGDWNDLIKLCKTLSTTPLDKLEEALKPMLDIDGVLWFLALDNALINNDGYWVRASDYNIYKDPKGVFHLVPHDMNEAFTRAMGGPGGMGPGGPGGRRGPGGGGQGRPGGQGGQPGGGGQPRDNAGGQPMPGGPRNGPANGPANGPGMAGRGRGGMGYELDPLIGMNDERKPLRSRLLAVPSLRAKYLEHVKTIASQSLDWSKLGPVVAQYRGVIEKEVEADTRKLESFAAFQLATADAPPPAADAAAPGPGRRNQSLRAFADARSKYLMNYVEPKGEQKSDPTTDPKPSESTKPAEPTKPAVTDGAKP